MGRAKKQLHIAATDPPRLEALPVGQNTLAILPPRHPRASRRPDCNVHGPSALELTRDTTIIKKATQEALSAILGRFCVVEPRYEGKQERTKAILMTIGENMQHHSWEGMKWEEVTHDISRKIITGSNEMIAQIYLKKDAFVPEHSHISEQISYILSGSLKLWVGGEALILGSGEVLVIPPNVRHKALALEDTLDIDVFSPIRQDWLDHTDTYFQNR